MRRSELIWLRWEDFDDGARVVRVCAKREDGEGWQPKTRRNRIVPAHPRVRRVLRVLAGRRPRKGWIFKSPEGKRWDPDNLSWRLACAMERAKPELAWTFLHFRHTFGTMLAMKGVSLRGGLRDR